MTETGPMKQHRFVNPAVRSSLLAIVGPAQFDTAEAIIDAAGQGFRGASYVQARELGAALENIPELAPVRPAFAGVAAAERHCRRTAALARSRHRGRLASLARHALTDLDVLDGFAAMTALRQGQTALDRLVGAWRRDAPALAAWAAEAAATLREQPGFSIPKPVEPETTIVERAIDVEEISRPPPPRPRSTEHDPGAEPENDPPPA